MTPRGTDWTLAAVVATLALTGLVTLDAGDPDAAWVFAVHDVLGAALVVVVAWKLRRVTRRVLDPRRWDRRTGLGALAALLVALALLSGALWSSGANNALAGFTLLAWHTALGAVLALLVGAHALARARPARRRDLADRRQFLALTATTLAGLVAWRLQRPVAAALGSPGAQRRFTGSYEADSFQGNAFPSTSWVADAPRPVDAGTARLEVSGLVAHPLALPIAALDSGAEIVATLDCTGGFHSTQHWRGIALPDLLARARPLPRATHVRVISRTGYRWSFPLAAVRGLLLATAVGDEALAHEHGAPLRLVAPGQRGFQWVKWVQRIELHEGPDPGALASTAWSSFTPAGRGRA